MVKDNINMKFIITVLMRFCPKKNQYPYPIFARTIFQL